MCLFCPFNGGQRGFQFSKPNNRARTMTRRKTNRNKRRVRLKKRIDLKKSLEKLRPPGSRSIKEFYERFKDYNEYLKSKEWKQIRDLYFIGKSKKCIVCGSKKYINLHHKSYKRLGGINEIKDLITVCRSCHKKIHDIEKKEGISVTRATNTFLATEKGRRKKPKDKKKIKEFRETQRRTGLKETREDDEKDKMIRDLRLKGIKGEYMDLSHSMIKKIHEKYAR